MNHSISLKRAFASIILFVALVAAGIAAELRVGTLNCYLLFSPDVEHAGKVDTDNPLTAEGYQEEMRKVFVTAKKSPMRFGYPDGSPDKHNHLLTASCPKPKD